ncbi:MAG: hypothetical protein ACRDRW_21055 [Pseudonocardiaceae bacterium]
MFGLSAEWLLDGGELIPSAVVLSHPEQLARLVRACPQAADVVIMAGDPCFDRMLASHPLRASYRRALGAHAGQRLVVVSSTWGASSLFGRHRDLVPRLTASLPVDEYRVVLALHPNIWSWHSPWQVRMWLADCGRAGVVVLPPEEGWRAALVAADLVIGDHGSVTFYGAALGHPVLLASAPEDAVDPRSPVGRLLTAAPRLDSTGDLAGQVARAITTHDRAQLDSITALATSAPGESARLLRRALYRMLDLSEPATPADVVAVPMPSNTVPPDTGCVLGSHLVHVQLTHVTEGDVHAEIVRYPADLLRAAGPIPHQAHLVVDTAEPYRRWLELADIVVLPQPADALPTLAAMPGCLLATAPQDAHDWVVVLRDGRSARFRKVALDGRVCASILHAWLTEGHELNALSGRVRVQLGATQGTMDVTTS